MRILLIVVGVFVLASALLAGVVYRGVRDRGTRLPGEAVLFAVDRGESFSSVKKRLASGGLVSKPQILAFYAWVKRYDRRIHVGTYQILPEDRPIDILDKFVAGDIHKVSVTIPEGFMCREIAGEFSRVADIDSTAFMALSGDEALRAELRADGPVLEGYLFPDTYVIPWGSGPEDVVRTMIRRLDEVFDEPARKRAEEIGMSRHEVLTLASIVEAETRLPEEQPLVAAVYHNRLRKGMRLEADPTVAYAKGGYRGRLYFKDLEIDSPYNTYRNEGLPPGPICSPGRAAIEAALYPDERCKAIYFVARGDGGHIFSMTLKDHLSAVRKVRQGQSGK